jgi:nanoRNase/pAp phosphatase (c-di-AMP/oligoRNAs hydrolase)
LSRNGPILKPPKNPGAFAVRRRFQGLLGKRRTMDNLPVLGEAHAAYLGLKRSAQAIRGRGANIFTQWVGDPDALGSAILLKTILTSLGAKEVRILSGSLGHPQNRKLVEMTGLVLQDPNKERIRTGLHCMVDTSPPVGMTNTMGVDPVNDYFFVADHHADPADVEANCRMRGVKRVQLPFVGLAIGSTSAFMAVIATAFGVLDRLTTAERAAAALGIYTDTSALLHGATPLDFKMFEVLTRTVETQDILDELRDYRVPPEWNLYRAAAFRNQEVTGAVRVGPVGFVRDEHRDVVAEIASELLRVEDTSIAVAIGVTGRGVEVSIRADSRLLGQNQQRIVGIIDYLLEAAFPGVSGFKHDRRPPHRVEGGACVPLTPEQRSEWQLEGRSPRPAGNGPILAHCKELARMLVVALRDLEALQPQDMEGLLNAVGAPASLRARSGEAGRGRAAGTAERSRTNGARAENGRTQGAGSANEHSDNGQGQGARAGNGRAENGRTENGRSRKAAGG